VACNDSAKIGCTSVVRAGFFFLGGSAGVSRRQRSFQPSMKFSIAMMRSWTEVKPPRRMACRAMIEKTSTRFSPDPDVGGSGG
jgi:hypothetical protein